MQFKYLGGLEHPMLRCVMLFGAFKFFCFVESIEMLSDGIFVLNLRWMVASWPFVAIVQYLHSDVPFSPEDCPATV